MTIESGVVVTIRHYSMLNVFKSIVQKKDGQAIQIRLPKECLKTVFLAGDPIVLAYEVGNSAEIKGGRILEFIKDQELLIFSADTPDEGIVMRSYERYPVSLYADYRVAEGLSNKKSFALIKDISDYGLLIYSNESHFKGLQLNMDIYLTRDILTLSAEIVRKADYNGMFEYGLKIKHNGPTVFNHIKNYVKKSQQELLIKFVKD